MARLFILAVLFLVAPSVRAQPEETKVGDELGSSISVVVPSVGPALERLEGWVRQRKGSVITQSRKVSSGFQTGQITVSLNPSKVGDFLKTVRNLGDVVSETSSQASGMTEETQGRVKVLLSNSKLTFGEMTDVHSFIFAGFVGAAVNQSGIEMAAERFTGGGISVTTSGREAQLMVLSLKSGGEAKSDGDDTGDVADEKESNQTGSSLALVSHNVYSTLLGDGANTFFNPYAGISYGIGRFGGSSMAAIGANLGVDLVKAKWLVWSVAASSFGFYNARNGGSGQIYSTTLAIPF